MHGYFLAQLCSAPSTAKPSGPCTWLGYMWEEPQLPICCISTLSPSPIQHQPPPSQVPANAGLVCSHFPTCVWIVHFSKQTVWFSQHSAPLRLVASPWDLLLAAFVPPSWAGTGHAVLVLTAQLCSTVSPTLPAVSLLWGSCPSHSAVAEHPAAIYAAPLKVSGQL